ncbi:RNA methyltransferase [Candidatus Bathyarchaeota archaeon]|nr:RNA methyltransferase [Candidatus Bathyarchaeota archaeon]
MHVRVILVEPEHEGNVGSVARAMKNFGFDELWIVNPKTEIGSQAKAYASHAFDILQGSRVVRTIDEALEDCNQVVGTTAISGRRSSNVLRTTLSPGEYARLIGSVEERVGLLFGRESLGLSNEELDKCDLLITIPASKEYRTLNVAMACTIMLYELHKHIHHVEKTAQRSDFRTNSRLVEYFERLANVVGTPHHRRKLAVRAFRNLISRGLLTKREALLLMGIVRRACSRTRERSESRTR